MKDTYERTELDIIEFKTQDVIMTSGPFDDEEPEDQYMLPVR